MRMNILEVEKSLKERLLYWVIDSVVSDVVHGVVAGAEPDWHLKDFFKPGGSTRGDPSFEIDHIPEADENGRLKVYASDEFSGIGLENGEYSAEEFFDVFVKLLVDYGKFYPDEQYAVDKIMSYIPRWRENLC